LPHAEIVGEYELDSFHNLQIAESSVFIFSKLFVSHSLGENVRMKESN